MGVQCTEVKFFLMTKFEDVGKFTDCSILLLLEQGFQRVQKNFCGTSPSMQNYDFKEFWPLNLTKSSEFDA